MASSLDAPKVFISYSWKPVTNKQKTTDLATRMTSDGINVILDDWNLSEGQDKYQFMEQMVNDPDIKRVLIICNKDYQEKANSKKGGVGTESLIISDEIYKQADQVKFIPIIFERDDKGSAYMPTFVKSRIYIDLSSDEVFEDEYEKLMRNIFDKPASKKPPLGTPPAYILEDEPTFLRTAHKVNAIKNALLAEKKNSQVFIDDYYANFIQALLDFEITLENIDSAEFIDEVILQKVEELQVLRDDFILFLETIFTYSAQLDLDKFIGFLEKLMEFLMSYDANKFSRQTHGYQRADQYRFFYNELFLYLVAVMIDKEKYAELGQILHNDFIIYNDKVSQPEAHSFIFFNQYAATINEFRNQRLGMRRVSIIADLIKQRANSIKYPFDKIKEYDALLYYVSIMRNEKETYHWIRWFPMTSVYEVYKLQILEKMISTRHFEKIKSLFNVNSVSELKQKIETTILAKGDRLQRIHHEVPFLQNAFDFSKIGTFK